MKVSKLKNMKDGWFVGNFEPSAYKTSNFEACYKVHPKGDVWDYHYHKEGTEINLLIKGKMKMHDKLLEKGDIFLLYPFELTNPEFLEDTEIVVVKTVSNTKDKYVINIKN